MLEHNDMKWLTVNELTEYEFCPADEEIINFLKARYSGSVSRIGRSIGFEVGS